MSFTSRQIYRMKSKYGLTAERFREMLAEQSGVCAICFKKCTKNAVLSIDHDHTTNEVRGLLCTKCNSGIGYFNDDPNLLRQATRYLSR